MLPLPVKKYLQARAIKGHWRISGSPANDFSGAVVIPALAESGYLFATLRSLAANPTELLARFLVLVVVNHREDGPAADKDDNYETLKQLAAAKPELAHLRLAWVDAASPGLELPAKGGGVGLARKIGLDLALSRLDFSGQIPLLISLDADTLTEPSYLHALTQHFRHSACGGAVIPFCHRPGATPVEQGAIDRYELFLRSYVLGLALAGSPYAFHTIGSAMACTASAYIRMSGMNRRPAAEDFYFLQQLHRTAGVEQLQGTLVFPSARPSHRVPFGTGSAISRTIRGNARAVMFYRPECFRILGAWLKLITMNPDREAGAILADVMAVSPHLAGYLESAGFIGVWERLRSNHRGAEALCLAFHGWFDGLKSMKLIHFLSAGPYPRCELEEAIPPLLDWAGLERVSGVFEHLALLRMMQNR
jgi:glycosyltransferase involved in cell wall biosynthesis